MQNTSHLLICSIPMLFLSLTPRLRVGSGDETNFFLSGTADLEYY